MNRVPSIASSLPDEVAFPLLRARLMSKRRVTESGCWEWTGWCHRNGYGETSFRGKPRRTHKLMWLIEHGPAPKGLDVMHKCDNAPCFNPDHLVLGTRQQNLKDCVARGRHFYASKTHCKRGHEFSPENIYVAPSGSRKCKICERAKQRIYEGWPLDMAYSAPKGYTGFVPKDLVRVTPPATKDYSNRTHCPHGHELIGANVYVNKDGYKKCRPCRTASTMRFQRQKPKGYENNPEAK